ncbi:MAG TPA: biopolymer transporter ExbD [Allosphingosinicella sp.]|jgi:biopolymer transport protein ExbD
MIQPRRRRAAAYAAPAEERLMSELNTTPLIDVMLVLLIMFILTVPIMTHSVKIDLPQGTEDWSGEPEIHRLALSRNGALTWNGEAIAERDLPARIAAFQKAAPDFGQLLMSSDPEARYEDFDRVLAVIKKSGVERLGFVGNERFADTLGR